MSLGKAMIHARKQKSIARAAAYAAESGTHQLCTPTISCRCRCSCSTRPTSPSTSAERAAPSCWCSRASRALKRSTASRSMRSAAASPCRPSFACLNTAASPTRPAPSRAKTSCCAIAITASTAAWSLPSGELTLDHVIPRSRGGNSTWENLVACCHACNRRKGNRMLVRNRRHDPAARAASVLAPHQPPDHAHARPRRRPLAQIPLLLSSFSRRSTRTLQHGRVGILKHPASQFINRSFRLFTRAIVRIPGSNFADGLTTVDLGVPHFDEVLASTRAIATHCANAASHSPRSTPIFATPTPPLSKTPPSSRPHAAILTRPGASSREGEVGAIRPVIERFFPTRFQSTRPAPSTAATSARQRTTSSSASRIAPMRKARTNSPPTSPLSATPLPPSTFAP